MLSVFLEVLRRDLLLAWRNRADVLVTLAFFTIVACLFPFGVGAERSSIVRLRPCSPRSPVSRAGTCRPGSSGQNHRKGK